jgi:hypothetical protein
MLYKNKQFINTELEIGNILLLQQVQSHITKNPMLYQNQAWNISYNQVISNLQ